MASIVERHNPSNILFPVNNRNTAWRPVSLPVILVVPHRRDKLGLPLPNSSVFNTRIYIENVPTEALVSGHDHIDQRFPDHEIYSENIDVLELADSQIDIAGTTITRNGEVVALEDAEVGDLVTYTTNSGITDTFEYLPDADYYDLSGFSLEIETLPPDRYNLVYEAKFYNRVVSVDESGEFLCIDINTIATTHLKFLINHPGDVMNEVYRLTPPPYLTNEKKSEDSTVALYRPFTDILQDVMDEQDLLERVNWVFDTPPEIIPYLSSLLGWDIPYFPSSLDSLRKAVLRRTVEFQQLKGSRRAIINLFKLFGFEILISNLWWSSDGKRFIRPGQRLPAAYADEEIQIADVCQVDLLVNEWTDGGFGEFAIPLLFRPQVTTGEGDFEAVRDGGDITIESYLVDTDSDAYVALQGLVEAISDNHDGYGEEHGCSVDQDGFRTSTGINDALNGLEVLGFSQILISGSLGLATNELVVGNEIPVRQRHVTFDREENVVNITLNGYFDMTGKSLFIFALYGRQKIIVPAILSNLQSNRFDIQVLTQSLTDFADPVTLEFALEFLERLKAFHSLLNVVRTRAELTETYEVTDWRVGGDIQQRYDIDAGRLQVPPAIIPQIPDVISDCTQLDPNSLGYKDADIELRLRKLANLPEEHEAWRLMDEREVTRLTGLRLAPMQPADRGECRYTHHGQDRITGTRTETTDTQYHPSPVAGQQISGVPVNPRLSPNDNIEVGEFDTTGPNVSSNSDSSAYGPFTREYAEIRTAQCELDGRDYAYKGRVDDELLHRIASPATERPRLKPCRLGFGVGVYYTLPAYSQMVVQGVSKPAMGSRTSKSIFSGGAPAGNIKYLDSSPLATYLNVDRRAPLERDSMLSRLYRSYGSPEDVTLHYHNRNTAADTNQWQNLAIQRPSLEIEKPTLHLPGCRFPMMNQLEEDYVSTWDARPWDDQYSTPCLEPCNYTEPTFLNATLETDTNGNEYLVFDSTPFTIAGNGLVADIPSFGSHVLPDNANFTDGEVVHAVYSEYAYSPYVVLDQTCEFDSAVDGGTITVDDPLFNSHAACGTNIIDFADGYPCLSGFFEYDGEDYSDWSEVLEGLGMVDNPSTDISVLFKMGSGIRSAAEIGYRFDCGCAVVNCDLTTDTSTICSTDLYLDGDGNFDWSPDHLETEYRLREDEAVGVCGTRMDGSIPTFLELISAS